MSNQIDYPEDTWVWGNEKILWGFEPGHQYTLKVLQPKKGKEGCLSLQYHNEKSESWFVIRGVIWALVIDSGQVFTALLRPGDGVNLPTGVIHRLMAVTEDAQVLEASTPDRHAADKNAPKDVVRLHCVFGRDCVSFDDRKKQALVDQAIDQTNHAIESLRHGTQPTVTTEKLPRQFSLTLG